MVTIREAIKKRRSLIRAIQARSADGRTPEAKKLCSTFLQSPLLRALHLAELDQETPFDECLREAEKIDPYGRRDEYISWFLRLKRNGSFRTICTLPRPLMALHRMANAIVTAQFTPRSDIYSWRKRGKDRLVEDLATTLNKIGPFVLSGDIKDCYPSVRTSALADLDLLPLEFVRKALDCEQLSFLPFPFKLQDLDGNTYSRHRSSYEWNNVLDRHDNQWPGKQSAPRGLMQGSPLSNTLLAAMLNHLPDALPKGVRAFLYSDNVFVVCPSAASRDQAREALVCYFNSHLAGPFTLTVKDSDPTSTFEALGYTLEDEPGFEIGPSEKNLQRLEARMGIAAASRTNSLEQVFSEGCKGLPAISPGWKEFIWSGAVVDYECARAKEAPRPIPSPPHRQRNRCPDGAIMLPSGNRQAPSVPARKRRPPPVIHKHELPMIFWVSGPKQDEARARAKTLLASRLPFNIRRPPR